MLLKRVMYDWRQNAGDSISGSVGRYYNLFHFPTPIHVRVDGEVVKTQPNACILSEPGQPRDFYFPEDISMNWFHAYGDICSLLTEYEIPLNRVFYPNDVDFLYESFRKMRMEMISNDPYKEDMADIYLKELIVKLARSLQPDSARSMLNHKEREQLEQLRWRVLSQPEKDWNVEAMASSVSLSASRFHAVYRMLFGSSPMKDLIHARVDAGKVLLMTHPKCTLPEIAEKLGYKNPYHFIRQFKAVTGITPGAYRNKQ